MYAGSATTGELRTHGMTDRSATDRKDGGGGPLHGPLLDFTPEQSSRNSAEEKVAQGLIRRRVKRRTDDVAESGTALVSPMMEPIALTKSSPDAAGAGRTTQVTAT